MSRGPVIYLEAYTVRRIPYTEDSCMLSLLSREQGLTSALWKVPATRRRRPGAPQEPQTFSLLRATLQRGGEDIARLRSFEELPGSYRFDQQDRYLLLCLLARATLLTVTRSPQEGQVFDLWQTCAGPAQQEKLALLDLLAGLHAVHGTWPLPGRCEECGHALRGKAVLAGWRLLCGACAPPPRQELAGAELVWLQGSSATRPACTAETARRLEKFLALRLPGNLGSDWIFSRIMEQWDKERQT